MSRIRGQRLVDARSVALRSRAGRTSSSAARWMSTLSLAPLVAGFAACSGEAFETAPPAFLVDPPRASAVSARPVDPKTVDLTVCFAPDPRLGDTLVLEGDDGPITLRRGGADCKGEDVALTGRTSFDVGEIARRQRTLDELALKLGHPLEFPVFRGRELVAKEPVPILSVVADARDQVIKFLPNWVTPDEVEPERSLLVRDPAVVGDTARTSDPCTGAGTALGKWTFGYLMKQIAGTTDAAAMTRSWLARWETAQTVNGLTIASRALMRRAIIDPWQTASGGSTKPLDLAKAPFRLRAIVNRIDLAENLLYGSGSGGELRFVFGAVGPPPSCTPLQFTVIFEFAVPRTGCKNLRDWATAWVDLGALTPGSAAYETALEKLTEEIVVAGAAPGKPNGSNLAQLRTNEIALLDLGATPGAQFWEMREFRLDTAGALAQTTVRRTPRPDVNETATLSGWVNANATAIGSSGVDYVPEQYPGTTPFRGGNALMVSDTHWKGPASAPITDPEVRHQFSLNTCSGCHARETSMSTPFMHVSALGPSGTAAPLSGFLTGVTVTDPVSGKSRTFHDLQDRQTTLAGIANRSCLFEFFRVPLKMTH